MPELPLAAEKLRTDPPPLLSTEGAARQRRIEGLVSLAKLVLGWRCAGRGGAPKAGTHANAGRRGETMRRRSPPVAQQETVEEIDILIDRWLTALMSEEAEASSSADSPLAEKDTVEVAK